MQYPILIAFDYEDFPEVLDLIQNKDTNLSFNNNHFLKCCIERGCLGIAKRLIKDPFGRVDPFDAINCNHNAFEIACIHGHYEIIKTILKYSKIDSSKTKWGIPLACHRGRIDIVKLLFKDPRIDASGEDSICSATQNEYRKIVKLLLKYGKDPSVENDYCIRHACKIGCIKMVKILCGDSRTGKRVGLKEAIKYNRTEVRDFLMSEILKGVILFCWEIRNIWLDIPKDVTGVILACSITLEM